MIAAFQCNTMYSLTSSLQHPFQRRDAKRTTTTTTTAAITTTSTTTTAPSGKIKRSSSFVDWKCSKGAIWSSSENWLFFKHGDKTNRKPFSRNCKSLHKNWAKLRIYHQRPQNNCGVKCFFRFKCISRISNSNVMECWKNCLGTKNEVFNPFAKKSWMKYLIDLLTLLCNKPFTSGCKVNIVLIMSQIDPIGDLSHCDHKWRNL